MMLSRTEWSHQESSGRHQQQYRLPSPRKHHTEERVHRPFLQSIVAALAAYPSFFPNEVRILPYSPVWLASIVQ